MFKLWCLAEDDLLDKDNYYCLRDTGQVGIIQFILCLEEYLKCDLNVKGLNRVQSAPRIGRAMCDILHRSQRQVMWMPPQKLKQLQTVYLFYDSL